MKWLRWLPTDQISRTHNAAWNWFARAYQTILQLAAVPIFLGLLGPSAYGLVVLNATLAASILFLDQLLSPALLREVSRYDGTRNDAHRMRDLLATIEATSCALAVIAASIAAVAALLITPHWADGDALNAGVVAWSLAFMAASLAAQWPGLIYAAGLSGLQRQGLLSASRVIWATLQYGGGALVLIHFGRNPTFLFAWLAATFLLQSLSQRWLLLRVLPGEGGGHIKVIALKEIAGFARGAFLVGVLGTIVTQLDKYVVAGVTTPQQFAAYGLAFAVAVQAITLFTGPYASAIQPLVNHLIASDRREQLAAQFQRWHEALLIVTGAACLFFTLFADGLIAFWLSSSPDVAAEVAAKARIFVAGAAVGGATTLYTTVLYATGRFAAIYVACALYIGVFITAALSMPWLTSIHYAVMWIVFNAIGAILIIPSVRRQDLPELANIPLVREAIFGCFVVLLVPFGLAYAMKDTFGLAPRAAAFLFGSLVIIAVLPAGRRQLLDSIRFALRSRR